MPRRDGTGPQGEGSMTGRGLGNCIKEGFETLNNFGFGKRRGQGRGFGRGQNSQKQSLDTDKDNQ